MERNEDAVVALEEKAKRLLKRCRYGEASCVFKEVASCRKLQRQTGKEQLQPRVIAAEISALEGLALCLSRQLDDSAAEVAQRQALELRCRAWQTGGVADGDVGLKDPAPYSDQSVPETTTTFQNIKKSKKEVAAAKKAALPCLRNLASYVSNQGRQVDAEMVLRTVLKILEDDMIQELTDDDNTEHSPQGTANTPSPTPSGMRPSEAAALHVTEITPQTGEEKSSIESEKFPRGSSVDDATTTTDNTNTTTTNSSNINNKKESKNRKDELNRESDEKPHRYSDPCGCSSSSSSSSGGGGDQEKIESNVVGIAICDDHICTKSVSSSLGAMNLAASTPSATTTSVPVDGDIPRVSTSAASSSIARRSSCPGDGSHSPVAPQRPLSGDPPAPPPPSQCSPIRQSGVAAGDGDVDRLENDGIATLRYSDRRESSADDVEPKAVRSEWGGEDPEQIAAVTRHHLAVVLYAQGRTREAQILLEGTVATLRAVFPQDAVRIAQALHDLAGVVRPADPGRACSLYREALELIEAAKGKNHFLTAPTLAKLGSLVGQAYVTAAAIPPAPAAPAGPGPSGVARAAGLAEAVCAPGETGAYPRGEEAAAAVVAAAGSELDLGEAESMIKRAVLIQGRYLGLRHPVVASSMQLIAELYRKQGRLSEAEPLFRKAIAIWENSPGPMGTDAVAALHGMAHCVLAGAGADWLGRFEEAFALVDQAYNIASCQPSSDPDGRYSSSRLLLEALRMIRSRQGQGRGNPQPASAAIMDGVWSGRWNPKKCRDHGQGEADGQDMATASVLGMSGNESFGERGDAPASSRGEDPRCAVCLEEVGERVVEKTGMNASNVAAAMVPAAVGMMDAASEPLSTAPPAKRGGHSELPLSGVEIRPDIGAVEAVLAEAGDVRSRWRLAYLPCGHRFHTHCIGRWLVHSSSCPSCRSRVEDDTRAHEESTGSTARRRSSSSQTPSPTSRDTSSSSASTQDGHPQTPREGRAAIVSEQGRLGDQGSGGDSGGAAGGDGPAPFC